MKRGPAKAGAGTSTPSLGHWVKGVAQRAGGSGCSIPGWRRSPTSLHGLPRQVGASQNPRMLEMVSSVASRRGGPSSLGTN